MINNIKCAVVEHNAADYTEVESIVLMLCKECSAGVAKINLPESLEAAVNALLAKYPDFHEVEAVNTVALMNDGKLLQITVVGCGEGKECTPANFRKAAGAAVRAIQKQKATTAIVAVPLLLKATRAHYLQAIAEGLYLGAYKFTECKGETKPATECKLQITSAVENGEAVLAQAEAIAQGVTLTRNLVNRPGNWVNPVVMAEEAQKVAEAWNLEIEVLDEKAMAEKGMNAILAVGQGSKNPPRMITLKYNGAGDAPYTAFVGKGITFDSGGISIKPGENMGEMKDDMAGAGAVLGAIQAIAQMKLPCNIIAILSCAENMPGGNAQRPGDVVKAANGKTIEVVNTDAEGRMVLADAVWYACEQGAKRVIDIATLTGAVIIALGNETSGIITNTDELAEAIKAAGKKAGEAFWQLPSLPECKEAIKSDVADLLNSAGRAGGCITGGLFVGEFVKEGVEWAHLDIGGTSTATKTSGFKVQGGTGFGAMTLIKYAGTL